MGVDAASGGGARSGADSASTMDSVVSRNSSDTIANKGKLVSAGLSIYFRVSFAMVCKKGLFIGKTKVDAVRGEAQKLVFSFTVPKLDCMPFGPTVGQPFISANHNSVVITALTRWCR